MGGGVHQPIRVHTSPKNDKKTKKEKSRSTIREKELILRGKNRRHTAPVKKKKQDRLAASKQPR